MLRRLGALVGACVEGREGRLRSELARARADVADAKREAARLRKLFDDAGEGQYNVLALIEGYQAKRDEAEEKQAEAERERDEAEARAQSLNEAVGRWRERVEPAEARAAELAAEVGALRERLLGALGRAESWAGKTLDELIEEVGNLVDQNDEVVNTLETVRDEAQERLAEEQERRGRAESAMGVVVQRLCGSAPRSLQEVLAAVQELEGRAAGRHGVAHKALGALIERVCGMPNQTLDDAYAALGTLKAQRDGAQRDAHHFREQAINREEELHRLKEATALKRGEAVRQAVEADRAAVAHWLLGLSLQTAAVDAGRALRGDVPWVPPPPPLNPSTPSKSSTESEAPHA